MVCLKFQNSLLNVVLSWFQGYYFIDKHINYFSLFLLFSSFIDEPKYLKHGAKYVCYKRNLFSNLKYLDLLHL
jgi:hypothetical protein